MIYHEIPDFDPENSIKLLASNDPKVLIEGLISIVFYSGDYNLSLEKAVQFKDHEYENVRACAIECLGHISWIHKHLPIDIVIPIIKNGLQDKSDFVQGKTEFAIDDICHFLKLNRSVFI